MTIHEFVDSRSRLRLADEAVRNDNSRFPNVGETISGFRLVEELGRGAMARVVLACERQLADSGAVALKVSLRELAASRRPSRLLQHTAHRPCFLVPRRRCHGPAIALHALFWTGHAG